VFRKSKMSIPSQILIVSALCLAGTSAFAQQSDVTPTAFDGFLPLRPRCYPAPPPCLPGVPGTPGTMPPVTPPNPMDPTRPPSVDTGDAGGRGAALASASFALPNPGGYLDNAIPKSMFRVRYDYMFDFNQPDRAEFFLAAWREISFHPHGILNQQGTFQTVPTNGGKGMDPISQAINLQEISAYLELAHGDRMSVFAEIPFRTLSILKSFHDNDAGAFPEPGVGDPHENLEDSQTTAGNIGDVILGFKYALLADPERYLTFQFRTFFPSGDSRNGMGTGHYSLEPALLFYRRVTERLSFQSEFKGWIPLGGTTSTTGLRWDGGVLTYGGGLGYDLIQRGDFRVTPLIELVGWSVLSGFETIISADHTPLAFGALGVPHDHGTAPVGITTILNLKLGVRTYLTKNDDVYLGFGQALTPERWYNQIARAEYRRSW
jgi:hypothetical protein